MAMNRGPKHVQVYYDFFDLDEMDDVYCEICGRKAVDIHHVFSRGMGGRKSANDIKYLMAVCREDHDKYGDKKQYRQMLIEIHFNKMIEHLKKAA